ncbi:hypothetical protein BU14_0184s0012 [Porphyra umbilicalis]|uniref:carbonic anhydrase n=1 Tax=Porphyra umbilicalis TaxID=2786 RepID=A0A1X6P756_PORUM|nr:hypothetical protein BU14_0184s0012 [Porphyra umbilicalis]|eukprot:OSX76585.1 hypothetical protein BU14_0184s0012 [Porphyra umbilicalis]
MTRSTRPARRLRAAATVAAASWVAWKNGAAPTMAADTSTPWAYHGPTGPAFWGTLDDGWGARAFGKAQSPIDLMPAAAVRTLPLDAIVQPRNGTLRAVAVPNGVQWACANDDGGVCGRATWAGHPYELVQAHLHVAGEHTLHGEVLPAELHLVYCTHPGRHRGGGGREAAHC